MTPSPQRYRGSGTARSYYILAGHTPAVLPLRVTEIGESWWPAGENVQRRCSPIIAVELVRQGRVRLEQDGRTATTGPDEAFVLRRGVQHRYAATGGPVHKSYIGLDGPLAEATTARLPHRVVLRDARRALRLFHGLHRLFAHQTGDWQADASQLAYRLLVELLMSSRAERGELMPAAVVRVLPLLEGRDGQALGMDDLARTAGVSPAHLHRLFRASLGTSPRQHAVTCAMRRAQADLMHTDRPCAAIAADLGYTPLYFSAVFRRVVGMAPSAFRSRHR